jgi:hypothetical protein
MSETLSFIGYRQPRLPSGDYEISATQTISLDGTPYSTQRTFSVAGERHTLPPTAVRAVFPPQGSLGDHTSVLPHVVLARSSLPWERSPGVDGPWLVLLVFSGAEQPTPQTVKLSALAASAAYYPAPSPEKHQSGDDPVAVIDVPRSLLTDLMPAAKDLPFLAHVRRGDEEVAVVIGNRPPQPGVSSTVHLVSVEGRYGPGGFDLGPARPGALVRLVTLANWRFACLSAEHTFPYLARALADQGHPFRLPDSGEPAADAFLRQGHVPMRHNLRQGGRTISWYRGPFATGPGPVEPRRAIRSADALLRYHPPAGMFDASYAAAWQLGRLLALQHATASSALYTWKRRRAQRLARDVPADHPLAVAEIDDTMPPSALSLLTDLSLLRGVPLRYLVPDERLLPAESIRFFHVDQEWVSALVDGASSIGRLTSADAERDRVDPPPVEVRELTGALIRSDLISGYPALQVDAYRGTTDESPLSPIRVERLSLGILLCLFEGVFDRFDLHQPQSAQHFGVSLPSAGHVSKPGIKPLPLGPHGTVPIAALARALDTQDSAEFARRMIETAERVTFLRSS